jgi:hypothetical protein
MYALLKNSGAFSVIASIFSFLVCLLLVKKRLLDFVHHLLKINEELIKNTTFRELAVFPSSGDKKCRGAGFTYCVLINSSLIFNGRWTKSKSLFLTKPGTPSSETYGTELCILLMLLHTYRTP